MNSRLRSVVTCFLCAGLIQISWAANTYAQGEAGRYSLENSLMDLKRSAQDLINKNNRISSRIDTMRYRMPELNEELQRYKKQQKVLKKGSKEIQAQLEYESQKTGLVDKNVRKLKADLNDIKMRNAHIQMQKEKSQKEKAKLQERVLGIEKSINNILETLEVKMDSRHHEFRRERDDLSRMLDATKRDLQRGKRESENLEKSLQKPDAEFATLKGHWSDLKDHLESIQNEYNDQVQINNQIQSEIDAWVNSEREKQSLVQKDIDAYNDFSHEIVAVIDSIEDTHQMLSTQFRTARGEYIKSIDRLEDVQKFLLEQKELLVEALQAQRIFNEQLARTKVIDNKVQGLNAKMEQLVNDQLQIKTNVESGKEKKKTLQKSVSDFQRELRSIEREVDKSKRMTESVLKMETKRYQQMMASERGEVRRGSSHISHEERSLSRPLSELEKLRDHQSELKQKLALLQGELKSVAGEVQDIQEEKMSMAQVNQNSLLQVKGEIRELELYSKELVNLMDVVSKKYNSRDIKGLQTSGEEKQLRRHIEDLKNENQNLQEEVLALMVVLDRFKLGTP